MILILNRPAEANFVLATIEKNGITSVITIDFPEKEHLDEEKMLAIALAEVLQLPEAGWSTELGAMVRENRNAIDKEVNEMYDRMVANTVQSESSLESLEYDEDEEFEPDAYEGDNLIKGDDKNE
jgi:hypothetical protein